MGYPSSEETLRSMHIWVCHMGLPSGLALLAEDQDTLGCGAMWPAMVFSGTGLYMYKPLLKATQARDVPIQLNKLFKLGVT